MIRSEVLSCELSNVGSFSPYQDSRKPVYGQNLQNEHVYSDCGGQFQNTGFKSFDGKYQNANGRTLDSEAGCTQIKEDSSDEIRDDETEQIDYPACQKGTHLSGSQGVQYTALQTLAPGYMGPHTCDYNKQPYGNASYYPGPFQRYPNSHPTYQDTVNVGQLYYHGQMSPALAHSPPGLLPMGCMQPSPAGMYNTGNVCVYLCNRDLWSKFHVHTCEMIITKQGR